MTEVPTNVPANEPHQYEDPDVLAILKALQLLADNKSLSVALETISPRARFPLRMLSPDVVNHFITENRFSVRERKTIIAEMGVDISPQDSRAFYEAYLDRVEVRPHAACMLESILVAAMSNNKIRSKLEKKPVSAMRLTNRQSLLSQVGDALDALDENRALPAEIVIGLFFEHAVRSFSNVKEQLSPDEFEAERRLCFVVNNEFSDFSMIVNHDEETFIGSTLDDVDSLLARSTYDTDAFDDGIALLYSILEKLEPDAPSNLFDRFTALATILPDLAVAVTKDPEIDAIAKTLELQGAPPAKKIVAWIHHNDAKTFANDLLSWLEHSREILNFAQSTAADMKEEASAAIAEDDISSAQNLLSQAAELNTTANAVKIARRSVTSALRLAIEEMGSIDQVASAMQLPELPEGILGETKYKDSETQIKTPLAKTKKQEASSEIFEQPSRSLEPEAENANSDLVNSVSSSNPLDSKKKLIDERIPTVTIETVVEDCEYTPPSSDFVTDISKKLPLTEPGPENSHAVLFAELIKADCLGVAAEIAEGLSNPPVSPWALRAASLARSPALDFTPAAQRLAARVTEASENQLDEISSALLFGAALHTAVFVHAAYPRTHLTTIPLGSFGPCLNDLRANVAELEYQFPPSPEDLARLVGVPRKPRRVRILRELETWADEVVKRSGPCQPSTMMMHRIAKPRGSIGAAIIAIKENATNASELVKSAVDRYGSIDALHESLREENAALGSRFSVKLPRISMEYLARRLENATDLLVAWLSAGHSEGNYDRRRDHNVRRTTESLKTHLEYAVNNLTKRIASEDDTPDGQLRAAAMTYTLARLDSVAVSLTGADQGFCTAAEIEANERDRLTPAVRTALSDGLIDEAVEQLEDGGISNLADAYELNRQAGAYATAGRIAEREGLEFNVLTLLNEQADIAAKLRIKTSALAQKAVTLSKLDLGHQERYPALTKTLEAASTELLTAENAAKKVQNQEGLRDLAIYQPQIDKAKIFLDEATATVRLSQIERVRELKTSANAVDADAILDQIESGLTLEAIENRIALLRDGRPIGANNEHEKHPMEDFSPDFILAASAEDWPTKIEDYENAFSTDGLLSTEADRISPAGELISTYFDVQRSVAASSPASTKIRRLLEELGFLNPVLDKKARLQSAKAWLFALRTQVRTDPDNWFLPPVFGSRAKGYFRLLVAEGSVLPEKIVSALDPNEPALILIAARLDITRRLEIARRLRGASQPAVLIDETLVAFAATRRETRLETVFACGLPYGRVEPYLTDATVLPPEMFFGREEEIRTIMQRSSDGCLVYGGRQLGKSALLSHIENTRHDPESEQIVIRDQVTDLGLPNSPAKGIWDRLHAKLSTFPGAVRPDSRGDRDKTADDIKLWLSQDVRRRIIALFDETDEFMSAESSSGFPEIIKLKDMMESTHRAFKVVFAGLHNVQRLHNVSNSPLAHLGDPIVIGPLNRTLEDKRAAHELVVGPMRAAGFQYETPETADKILAYANDYPSLVQEYSKGLLAQLHRTGAGRSYTVGTEGPLWTIPDSILFEHESFSRIQENIRKKFRWTLDLDVRYALVAYTLALMAAEGQEREVLLEGLPPREILEEASPNWPQTSEMLDVSAFEVILDEMWDLGILGRRPVPETNRYLYCLRSPQVAAILGSWDDVVEELAKIKDREGKPSYDKATYRRSVNAPRDQRLYMPLTDLQIERILDPKRRGVKIVCGLKFLGLDNVGRAFARVHEELGLPGPRAETRVRVEQAASMKESRKLFGELPGRDVDLAILVYEGDASDDIENLIKLCDSHPKVIDGVVRPIFPVDATKPDMRQLAARRKEDAVYLAPWGTAMLRMYLRQIEAPAELDTQETRKRILEVTGGVPDQVVTAVENLIHAEDLATALDGLYDMFPPPEALKKKDLVCTLEPLITTDSPELYSLLDEEVKQCLHMDLVTLVPDLQAMGLVEKWSPKRGLFELSALGEFLRQQIGKGEIST